MNETKRAPKDENHALELMLYVFEPNRGPLLFAPAQKDRFINALSRLTGAAGLHLLPLEIGLIKTSADVDFEKESNVPLGYRISALRRYRKHNIDQVIRKELQF